MLKTIISNGFQVSSLLKGVKMQREIIATTDAPAAVGAYSQGIKVGNQVFVSGCIPLDAKTGAMIGTTAAEQAQKAMENLGAILKAGGADYDSVIKTTVLLDDINNFGSVNEVYATFFPSNPPARCCFAVKALPKGALVEIDAIALAKN
eukprot:GCRY01000650.1.p1 GENE.GCRY01000650.1~~GCRY01000650.1.p1  ORF type:complete len:149 (+),score=39.73 GCRY01000650.1:36-482(+)